VFELEHDARLESRTRLKAHNLTIVMPKSVALSNGSSYRDRSGGLAPVTSQ
jgi:hypothetical protein